MFCVSSLNEGELDGWKKDIPSQIIAVAVRLPVRPMVIRMR